MLYEVITQGIPVFDGSYAKAYVLAFYMEDTENYTAHHNLVYNITSNNYTGSLSYTKAGAFLYLGPRFNYMDLPVNFYNNTVWNYDKSIRITSYNVCYTKLLRLLFFFSYPLAFFLSNIFTMSILLDRLLSLMRLNF